MALAHANNLFDNSADIGGPIEVVYSIPDGGGGGGKILKRFKLTGITDVMASDAARTNELLNDAPSGSVVLKHLFEAGTNPTYNGAPAVGAAKFTGGKRRKSRVKQIKRRRKTRSSKIVM